MYNIKFKGKSYAINKSLLSGAISSLEATLSNLSGDTPEEPEVLEGTGTALSFRSKEPLSEFQEVKVNGQTVDPSNYTLEEGSTIVKLSVDYLKTLDVGNYDVAVVSANKTVSGNFTVTAPTLNEYGFYYNQPYVANVAALGGRKVAFFIRDDGTLDTITIGSNTSTCTYTTDGDTVTIVTENIGTLTATLSSDPTEIFCNTLQTTFKLGDSSIAADEDYIYILYTGDTQAIMCYDWDGRFCGVYRIDAYQEDEALFHVGDQFYITFYTGSGGRVYKLDFDKDLLF